MTTVPRPEIENTSSIGIRNGLSSGRSGVRDPLVDRLHQLEDRFLADFRVLVLEDGQRRTRDDRNIVAVEAALRKLLADFELDQLEQLGIVDLVDLVEEHDHGRDADLPASRMCSLVCGIGPSAAETTRIAPSIWAAPVIMFFT